MLVAYAMLIDMTVIGLGADETAWRLIGHIRYSCLAQESSQLFDDTNADLVHSKRYSVVWSCKARHRGHQRGRRLFMQRRWVVANSHESVFSAWRRKEALCVNHYIGLTVSLFLLKCRLHDKATFDET